MEETTSCSSGTPQCQLVFGRYDLLLANESNPAAVIDQYRQITHSFIEQGVLQEKIFEVDPNSQVIVQGISNQLQPSSNAVDIFPNTPSAFPSIDLTSAAPSLSGAPSTNPSVSPSSLPSNAPSLYPTTLESRGTAFGVIAEDPSTSAFSTILSTAELRILLSSNTDTFTVFSPVDMRGSRLDFYNRDGWKVHFNVAVRHHIVEGAFFANEIFDGIRTTITSMGGTLVVLQPSQTISGQSIATPDVVVSNGIVHKMSGVLSTSWDSISIGDLRLETELSALRGVLESFNFIEPLNAELETGMTFLAASDPAFSDGKAMFTPNIFESDNSIVTKILAYNVIDKNIYQEDFRQAQQQVLVLPRNEEAHMWLTVDADSVLRFNDAKVESQILARNG